MAWLFPSWHLDPELNSLAKNSSEYLGLLECQGRWVDCPGPLITAQKQGQKNNDTDLMFVMTSICMPACEFKNLRQHLPYAWLFMSKFVNTVRLREGVSVATSQEGSGMKEMEKSMRDHGI